LLAVASRYGSFPVLLETYRECLRDFFDMPALVQTLADLRSRKLRLATVDSDKPSPFAASLLFSYVASFLYDRDAPLAERRAHAPRALLTRCRRVALHRGRGRCPLSGRARRAAAARRAGGAAHSGPRCARRSRAALRAHACAVQRRRVRRPLRADAGDGGIDPGAPHRGEPSARR